MNDFEIQLVEQLLAKPALSRDEAEQLQTFSGCRFTLPEEPDFIENGVGMYRRETIQEAGKRGVQTRVGRVNQGET